MNKKYYDITIPWEVADIQISVSAKGIFRLQFKRLLPYVQETPAQLDAPFPFVGSMREQFNRYLSGENINWQTPLDLSSGTSFQQRVWRALMDIPFGETCSYGDLAISIGQPGAARAVGNAAGANPVPIIVPCHRLVASGGKIGGFSAGLEIKRALLHLEGCLA